MSDLPLDALPPSAHTPPNAGRMIVTLTPNGTSRPLPTVTFDPVGMFTPGLLNDHLVHFAQEVERAQAKVRHENDRIARERKA